MIKFNSGAYLITNYKMNLIITIIYDCLKHNIRNESPN